jgi:pyruvate kinase
MDEVGRHVPVVAKIERAEAVEGLVDVLEAADGAMVARGDLGVEMAPERVPLAQKRIIAEANRLAVPVITATQMLESMIESPIPTRAEASDVANAIIDGTDAVMLSGETAVGRNPVRVIETAARIAEEMWAHRVGADRHLARDHPNQRIDSTAEALCSVVDDIVDLHRKIGAIWVVTRSGRTAHLVSAQRPRVRIFAFTPNVEAYRRMSILWGVRPVLTDEAPHFDALERAVTAQALEQGLAQPGDVVVMTGSHPFEAGAGTNFVKVLEIPEA